MGGVPRWRCFGKEHLVVSHFILQSPGSDMTVGNAHFLHNLAVQSRRGVVFFFLFFCYDLMRAIWNSHGNGVVIFDLSILLGGAISSALYVVSIFFDRFNHLEADVC